MDVWITIGVLLSIALIIYFLNRDDARHPRGNEPSGTLNKEEPYINGYARKKGQEGERIFQKVLRQHLKDTINGYITSENIYFDKQNFEVDFLIMVPKVGFVLAEVKSYAGKTFCTAERNWKQVTPSGQEQIRRNASKQVLRTRALLKKLLKSGRLDKWPILPLVVFVDDSAKIFQAKSEGNKPQTPVIRADMLNKWLDELPKNSRHVFTRNEYNQIRYLIKSHEREYTAQDNYRPSSWAAR